MDIKHFVSEQAFDAARAKDPSHYYYYALEFDGENGFSSGIVYLCTSKKAPEDIEHNGRKFLLFKTKEDLTSSLKDIEAFASGDAPISETADATDTTSTLAPSNAVDTPSESSLPISHSLEAVCEFFASEEEFIKATEICSNFTHICLLCDI